MTTAPANLLAARRLLIDHLNIDEDAVRGVDLEPDEVGIVGNAAHRGGYHCGSDRVVTNDYSVVESARDRTGLSDYASALDVGDFSVSVAGKRHTLATFSMWLVAQCKAGTVDTRDVREVIYSPDGVVVRRWDRLGRRTSGDSSHRWHTHISYHRDAVKAGRDQSAVFTRYLTTIGLLEDDMPTADEIADAVVKKLVSADVWPNGYGDAKTNPSVALGTFVKNAARDTEAARKGVEQLADRPAAAIDYDQLADALLRRVVNAGTATTQS